MATTNAQKTILEQHGFAFEHPGVWCRTVGDVDVTISDGTSINGEPFEVQYSRDGVAVYAVSAEIENAVHAVECDLADAT